ncbi:hypothetical protein L2750_03380 [Shewanella submarina]|uniref:Lipoprotein n=1 Tax=Shewanella submarina TaxID=2016376 RepID=A0ABV7GLF5_9GAMM|nr:hypothetical protein [Shewanella submarina]MCL1036199.1 hypothetical protein [Shewanella submarina]
MQLRNGTTTEKYWQVYTMKRIGLSFIISTFMLLGCAQIPKEAVELSATVGRDMVEMKKAHVSLINIYYQGLIDNTNKFIDEVYLPYQIQQTLSHDLIKLELMNSIEMAGKSDSSKEERVEAFEKLKLFHLLISEEVEKYRREKIVSIEEQRARVLSDVGESYERIHYANSIVTGHLASVVKVHDAQNELLSDVGLSDLRVNVGENLTSLSLEISELTKNAVSKENDLDKAVKKFEEVYNRL